MNGSPRPTDKSRFFRSGWIRRLGLSLVFLFTLFFLIHAVENWRGSRTWAQTLAELEAKGVDLKLVSLLPPPVPDEENIAMHPAFRGFTFTQPGGVRTMRLAGDPVDAADAATVAGWNSFRKWSGQQKGRYSAMVNLLQKKGEPQAGLSAEVAEFQVGLANHQSLLDGIREALQRPSCRWPDIGSRHRISTVLQTSPDESPEHSIMLVGKAWRYVSLGSAMDGDLKAALREASVVGDLHRVIWGQGNLVTYLFASTILDTEVDTIGRALGQAPTHAANFLEAVGKLSKRPGSFAQYREVLIRDQVYGVAAASAMLEPEYLDQLMSRYSLKLSLQQKVWQAILPKGWEKQRLASQFRLMSDRIAAHDSSLPPMERIARESASVAAASQGFAPYRVLGHGDGDFAAGFLAKDIRRALTQIALLAAEVRSRNGRVPENSSDFPASLAESIPPSPMDGAAPIISRDSRGIWTVNYPGMDRLKPRSGEPVIHIPGW